ncbi:hypothetical protein [Micromonospora sp. C95]|uniref:hypothetical protein n=1 Tax=Micromonospora sp. C95 TaxID=2824882 RepID=UPI001B39B8A0|nr:hypothetical protein [Micromonospora sp. C95]MBQ1026069.1 hypothetical protein [Micromonospora sp. C95]
MTTGTGHVVLDAGSYPIDGAHIGGIGLRICELAETLAEFVPTTVMAESVAGAVPVGRARLASSRSWRELVGHADAVMFFDGGSSQRLHEAQTRQCLIIVENAPPIEQLEYPSLRSAADPGAVHRRLVEDYAAQLRAADHFLCRSAVERVTLLANLCLTGRLSAAALDRSRTLEHLVSLVPIGFSASSAERAARAAPQPGPDLLWTGGLWAYFDPVAVVEAVKLCHDAGHPVSLGFLYGRAQPDNKMVVDDLLTAIRTHHLEDWVELRTEPISHLSRDGVLKGSKALVSIAKPGIENDTCVRLRIRDSRLYGRPLLCDNFGPTAVEAAADGLGTAVDPRDRAALAAKIMTLTAGSEAHDTHGPIGGFDYTRSAARFLDWLVDAIARRRARL